eukprot:gnl/TRDRNA2_/TRDRNA2_97137_c1_seq1.p1 gnl/TRDRNA2_/TRDRNA2_97137_c1~~gnl/TRDRNA2_/TRDRNA2_97137_c1_seq1.p1  ORF type:complete len:268 (+),score=25.10 gnl/TRDRNA2_/TRDRNA2_97137_c1_seq1:78-806(+)
MELAGTGLFVVVYSSKLIFIALFAVNVLHRKITLVQWLAVFAMCAGQGLSFLGAEESGFDMDALWGICGVLAGAVIMSGTYIMSEYVLSIPEGPNPKMICAWVGVQNLVLMASYFVVFAVPYIRTLLVDPFEKGGGTVVEVVGLYLIATATLAAHYVSFYQVCKTSAVGAAVNSCVQTVGVFAISTIFCSTQQEQCFTILKGASVIVVCGSVLIYAISSTEKGSRQQHAPLRGALLESSPSA